MTNRHTKILEVLSENKRMEVTALAELLDVSQVTIRKDLDQLEEKGLIRREHGYASIDLVDDVGKRLAYHYTIKKRIAQAAAVSVQDGETVMIESGSCCTLLAEELANTKRDVTIVTNSAFIANHIRYAPHGKIILLGGYYQKESQVLVGPLTRKCAEIFFADKFFIGVDGFMEKTGFTGNDHLRAQTVQDLAEQVRQILVLTDSEKFSHQGMVGLVRISDVDAVYTDDKIPADIEAHLTERNITVCKVSSKGA
ncbi:MAG: DeoR/GlpR family DNA-binding transcription regulator [Treponema sp.]|jgi:DeoR/GlpR family transcriptional regulator of sugar metabolism|nr:DeoR/GlpR family DNA-binding transcription regulator [Treponema sp.]